MSAIRFGTPGSACTEEYGRSPHNPTAYLKLLSLPASLPATAIPAAPTATTSTKSPTAKVFRTICLQSFRASRPGGRGKWMRAYDSTVNRPHPVRMIDPSDRTGAAAALWHSSLDQRRPALCTSSDQATRWSTSDQPPAWREVASVGANPRIPPVSCFPWPLLARLAVMVRRGRRFESVRGLREMQQRRHGPHPARARPRAAREPSRTKLLLPTWST